jgi:hypothetical protein
MFLPNGLSRPLAQHIRPGHGTCTLPKDKRHGIRPASPSPAEVIEKPLPGNGTTAVAPLASVPGASGRPRSVHEPGAGAGRPSSASGGRHASPTRGDGAARERFQPVTRPASRAALTPQGKGTRSSRHPPRFRPVVRARRVPGKRRERGRFRARRRVSPQALTPESRYFPTASGGRRRGGIRPCATPFACVRMF